MFADYLFLGQLVDLLDLAKLVCPQKVFCACPIWMIFSFCVEVDECCKLEILFLKSISSTVYNGSWQMTSDS